MEGSSLSPPLVALTMGAIADRAVPYVDALQAAGLRVRVLGAADHTPEQAVAALRDVQGLVLAGGGDIDPALLGCDVHPTVADVDPRRDAMECAVFRRAWERELPVLAICRGMQLMNWVLGGTLHADVDACVSPYGQPKFHRQTEYGKARHEIGHTIHIRPGTHLAEILGAGDVEVNTIHHQCLDRVADSLTVTAVAPDGVIEAVEVPNLPFVLGVQFHPEAMFRHHPPMLKLFAAFAQAVHADAAARARR